MARLRYQPATNPRGFQPIQLSSAGITRMQEENNRVIRNLEKRSAAEISQRERNLAAMEQNQAAEAAKRESNFQSEQRALKQQQANAQAEEKFAIENRKDPNKDLQKVITGLADFSQTIGKIAAQRTKQMIVDQTALAQKNARDDFYSNPAAQIAYKNVESVFPIETAKLDSLTTDGLASGELTLNEASKDFFANPGRNAYYDKAYKNTILELSTTSLTENLLQSTEVLPQLGFAPIEALKDPDKMSQVTQYALETNLEQLGLSDANPGYYQEPYEKIVNAQKVLINRARTAQTKDNFEKQAEQATFLRTNLSTIAASFESDRVNPNITRQESLDNLLSTISMVDPRTGEALFSVEDIDNTYLPSFNKTVGEVWGGKGGNNPSQAYLQALRDRNRIIRQFRTNEEADQRLNAKDFARNVAIELGTQLNQKDDSRDVAISRTSRLLWQKNFPGISYPQALIEVEELAFSKNSQKEDEKFAARAVNDAVPLTQQEIDTIQNPANKKKYQAIFVEQQIKRFGPEFPEVLKSLKAKAIEVAGFDPTVDGSINPTTVFLLNAMKKKTEKYALEGEKSGVKPEFISEYAVNKLNEYIAKGSTDKTNLFYKEPNSPDNAPSFPNLYGNAAIQAQLNEDKESTKTLDIVLNNRNLNIASVINMPYVLGDQNDYERISAQIENDPLNVEYTAEIMKISRMTQRTKRPMSPREVYNASISAVNAVSMRDPVIPNEVNPVEDAVFQLAPEVQKLYNDVSIRTFNRAKRLGAEINNSQGGGNNLPRRASMNGTGVAPVDDTNALVETAEELGVNPIDLATIIGFETGGSYNPSQWGGQGGQYMGLIQFGPSEREKYGVVEGMSFRNQLISVAAFLKDRFEGVGMSTQGATLEDLYTTVLAGNPKANRDAQDSFGTSARSGVAKMDPHRERAMQYFGLSQN